ncbi:hypothetical protein O1611_g4379 [Lasiodiplodia mahajangana]|uniref:Uncharacterized protein n=1 Tax=Lasiodiplodia mahajangana TaxID=1108764 RepID=A0ACC2JPD6_9PEZI|nr:hypothetical protein O1611_g4379 [Lasiodiplodia mahajangana]
MSDLTNHPTPPVSNTSNATSVEYIGPLASPLVSSIANPDSHVSSISTHTSIEEVSSSDNESPVTSLTNIETDNPNRQAEHGNRDTRGTTRGGILQRRGVPIPPTIRTLPGITTTDRQEPGFRDLATGNAVQAPSVPTRDLEDPTSFGVLQTNHNLVIPPCPEHADNFYNFGISSVADFSEFGIPASVLSHPMERSKSSETTATSSNLPPAERIDDGVPSEGVVLLNGDTRPNTPANGNFPDGQTSSVPSGSDLVDDQGTATGVVSAQVIDSHQGVERGLSEGNTSNIDHVQENALDGRGYSIGANNERDRRAPRLVGSLTRMNPQEVSAFWGDVDGSDNHGGSRQR